MSIKDDDIAKWTKESLLDRPFLSTWIGSWLVFFGVTILLISSLFLEYRPKRADWTSFWGMVSVLVGGSMFSASTFINQPILISLGGIFLTLGLGLYMAFLAWKLHDDYDYTSSAAALKHNAQNRAILGVVAMITVLVGIYFFIKKSIQRFVRPYVGPNNFFLYGPLLFGGGTFTYFLVNIDGLADVNERQYYIISGSARMGGYLFSAGAFVLLLAVSRSFYSYDLLIIPSYPSIVSLGLSTVESMFLCAAMSIMSIGGFLLVVGQLLLQNVQRAQTVTVASLLVALGYFSVSATFLKKSGSGQQKINSVGIALGRLCQGLALGVYALGVGLTVARQKNDINRAEYSSDLRTAGSLLGLAASVPVFFLGIRYRSPELLSPGNYASIADILSFSAFLTTLLPSLNDSGTLRPAPCGASSTQLCHGTISLAAILFSGASLMYLYYFAQALDYASIHGMNVSSSQREKDENLPFGLETAESVRSESIPVGATVLETDVLVVGCGPSGLNLTCELGLRGIKVMAIDTRNSVQSDARFFNLLYTTTEGLKRIGVLDKVLSRSLPQSFGHGSISGTGFTHPDAEVMMSSQGPGRAIQERLGHRMSRETASMVFTSKWAGTMSQRCMQSTQEECLKERAEECPSVDVRYGWELISFTDQSVLSNSNQHPITAQIKNTQTQDIVFVKARYIVGCDGPGSLVSKTLKVKFDGFANLGQTRTVHIHARGLLAKIRPRFGDALQYHVSRPGYGVGWFVLNYFNEHEEETERWTFFLLGLTDGRQPRQLSKEDMLVVVKEFIGPDANFEIVSDVPWFWNLFFARRLVYGHSVLCGDAAHSWPPFGGIGGNTGYGDAANLGWKLAAVIKGWGNKGMLESYDTERRQFGLKIIMMVLNFAPDREQVLRIATLSKWKWLWWTFQYRWLFASRGAHAGNHFNHDGAFLGSRYSSQIICSDQDVPPLEDPPSKHTPCITCGGHIPHIRFADGSDVSSFIAFDGYTLLVTSSTPQDLKVKDKCRPSDLEASTFSNSSVSGDLELLGSCPVIRELCSGFAMRGIPIRISDISEQIKSTNAQEEALLVSLYSEESLVLVRPDMYIAWHLSKQQSTAEISAHSLLKIAQVVCSEIIDDDDVKRTKQLNHWLTRRFIGNIQGYRHLHRQAIYFENEDKASVIQAISKKAALGNSAGPVPQVSLVTKAVIPQAPKDGQPPAVDDENKESILSQPSIRLGNIYPSTKNVEYSALSIEQGREAE